MVLPKDIFLFKTMAKKEEEKEDNSFSWERIRGFLTENDIDARWILRKEKDNRAFGSLRVVSHPDLKPGYLRAFWTIVTKRRPKTDEEILAALDEYQMEQIELELYSVNEHIETEIKIIEQPMREIEKLFNIKIFE